MQGTMRGAMRAARLAVDEQRAAELDHVGLLGDRLLGRAGACVRQPEGGEAGREARVALEEEVRAPHVVAHAPQLLDVVALRRAAHQITWSGLGLRLGLRLGLWLGLVGGSG